MIIKNNYLVDFRRYKFINSLLGFHSKLYISGFNEAENMVNFLTINSILGNIDIISGSYVNGSIQPTIYSFFSDVSSEYKIIENHNKLLYLPITSYTIHGITIWLTDQNRNELNFRGENLSMWFHLRDLKKIFWVLKMKNFINVKVRISDGQKGKLKKAFESNCKSITIRLTFTDLHDEDVIAITKSHLTD